MNNPAQDGINAARRDAEQADWIERSITTARYELINEGLAPEPEHDNAIERLQALATAYSAHKYNRAAGLDRTSAATVANTIARYYAGSADARNYAQRHLAAAIDFHEEQIAQDARSELTEQIIEATIGAYADARGRGSDGASAIVAAMKAAIAAGADVDEAAQDAQIAHENWIEDNDLDETERAALREFDALAAGIDPATIDGAAYDAAHDLADANDRAAELIAADAIQAAWITRREEELTGSEGQLARAARAIVYQPHGGTEEQYRELADYAMDVHAARATLAATRASYGLTAAPAAPATRDDDDARNERAIADAALHAIAYYRDARSDGAEPEQALSDARQLIHDKL